MMDAVAVYRAEKQASAERNARKLEAERAKIAEACARLTELSPRERARRRRGESPKAVQEQSWYARNREKKIAAVKARRARPRVNRNPIRRFDV